ncbi:MAG: hypothetical protein Q8M54_00895 [Desulfobaccales bacterium]|nr:hypothetical protein [Desulfobaccales bacterium]
MKIVAMLMVILMVSSCALSMEREWRQRFTLKIKTGENSDAKLIEDMKQCDKEKAALDIQIEKANREWSIFESSLSDKELLASSDISKAVKSNDDALAILARRKFERLLSDSGKIVAYRTLGRESDEIVSKIAAMATKLDGLDKRREASKRFWVGLLQELRERQKERQHRELINALHGISNNIWLNSQQQIWMQQMRAGQVWIQQHP